MRSTATLILFFNIFFCIKLQSQDVFFTSIKVPDSVSTNLPVAFDLRNNNRLGPVKSQPDGGCWASAVMGSIESEWKTSGFGNFILSDMNLKLCHGFDPERSTYGNHYMATAYFSRGSGPLVKSDTTDSDCDIHPEPAAYITDARYLPNDPKLIKKTIKDLGSVYTMLYFRKEYLDTLTNVYYCNKENKINHAIDLIGWNDTLVTKSGKGVWIVQNSLGTSFGENGFFYIPYTDPNILKYNAIWPGWIPYTPAAEIYYYDTLGSYRSYGFHDSVCYGLVKFTTREDLLLSKIGTSVNQQNTRIYTEIYRHFDTIGGRLSGNIKTLDERTCTFAGYYTFDLDKPVILQRGEDFYILMRYTTPNDTMPIPIETFIRGYSEPNLAKQKCWINPNYQKWPNAWYECGTESKFKFLEFNLCIKAYTVTVNKK